MLHMIPKDKSHSNLVIVLLDSNQGSLIIYLSCQSIVIPSVSLETTTSSIPPTTTGPVPYSTDDIRYHRHHGPRSSHNDNKDGNDAVPALSAWSVAKSDPPEFPIPVAPDPISNTCSSSNGKEDGCKQGKASQLSLLVIFLFVAGAWMGS